MAKDLTTEQFELARAIISNRFSELIQSAEDTRVAAKDRKAAMAHAHRVGDLLIAIDEITASREGQS